MINTGAIFRAFIVITMLSVTLIGCSSGSDDPAPASPTTSSNWDQMEWDKGTWSN